MRRRSVARTVGRTAVIAGTATAVSGRVAARQSAAAAQPAAAAPPPPAAAPAPAPAPAQAPAQAPGLTATAIEQLTALAALRDQGVLTDAEFDSEKAKILNG